MFLALNAKTGATLWSYGCASNCGLTFSGATPAVGNGAVYFGCSTRSLNGGLCALEASNGNLLWTYQAGTGNAAVSVSDGTVYMEQELSGNTDEPIVALNSSGSPLWTTTLACCGNLSPPAVGGGRVYALVSGNALEALNAKTGKVSWTSSPSCGGEDSSPSIANGVVYVTPGVHCSDTFALDAKNGTLLWDAPTGGRGYGAPPIILNGTLYAQCWNMCAYDLSSAEVKRGSPIR
jgi:outer membrane protein assembly factor BamB